VNASFAFWGQFLTARGTFNARAGRRLRVTGAMPFWPRYAWCRLDELERHLAARGTPGAQEEEHFRPERNAG